MARRARVGALVSLNSLPPHGGDTLYIGQGGWHQHHIRSDEAAMVFTIPPLPIQEYMGELNIVYKGDKPKINPNYKAGTFLEEFAKIGKK